MTATEELDEVVSDLVIKRTKEVLDEMAANLEYEAGLNWDFEEPWKIRVPSGDGVVAGGRYMTDEEPEMAKRKFNPKTVSMANMPPEPQAVTEIPNETPLPSPGTLPPSEAGPPVAEPPVAEPPPAGEATEMLHPTTGEIEEALTTPEPPTEALPVPAADPASKVEFAPDHLRYATFGQRMTAIADELASDPLDHPEKVGLVSMIRSVASSVQQVAAKLSNRGNEQQ